MTKSILRFVLNGRPREDAVAENLLLLDYLREVTGLTGTKRGCDGGECGAFGARHGGDRTCVNGAQPRAAARAAGSSATWRSR